MLTLPDLDIVRTWQLPVRADDDSADDGTLGLMEVRFSVFDSWYEIDSFWEGKFLERTSRGSFRKTIADHNGRANPSEGVKVLFNHGSDPFIGDKLLGGIRELSEKKDSPVGVVALDDTSYNRDLLPGLRRGGYGSSFMFRVIKDEWNDEPGRSEHNPDGIPERTIKEVRLFEFGPVTWPANPSATSGMRCLSGTDLYYENLRARSEGDRRRVDDLRSRISALRTPDLAPAAAEALADEGAAPQHTDEPARHSDGDAFAFLRERHLYLELEGVR